MSAPLAADPGPAPEPLRHALGPTSPSGIAHELRRWRFRVLDEAHVQAGLASILDGRGVRYEREKVLPGSGGRDRIDFLTADGVGIEVKVAGAVYNVHRQLRRYAESPAVTRLLLVTTRRQHEQIPLIVRGVSVLVEVIRSVR